MLGEAVVTVKAMRNISVGYRESHGWEGLKPGGLGSGLEASRTYSAVVIKYCKAIE